jgi:integrase
MARKPGFVGQPRQVFWELKDGGNGSAWRIDYVDASGKRRYKQAPLRAEVLRKIDAVRAELRLGVHVADRATITFAQAYASYYRALEEERLRGEKSSPYVESVDHFARQNVLPRFGELKLTELTAKMVQDWAKEMRLKPRPPGAVAYKTTRGNKPYGAATVERMVGVIRRTLSHAVDEGWLVRSVLKDTRVRVPPERFNIEDETDYPTMDDLQALLDTLDTKLPNEGYHYWRTKRVLFTLLLFCGMRRGEAIALQWSNVDFSRQEINLRYGFNSKDKLRLPKTKAGVRTIPMVQQVYDVLRWQAEEGVHRTGYVLRARDGGHTHASSISGSWWRKLMKAAGLSDASGRPKFTLHKLRYATVARLLKQGLKPYALARLVGHQDLRMIMQVYAYELDNEATRAVMDADAALLRVEGPRLVPPPATPLLPAPGARFGAGPVFEGTVVVVPPAEPADANPDENLEGMTRRRQGFTLYQRGWSMAKVGKRLGVSEATVNQWLRKVERLGPEAGAAWLDKPEPLAVVGTTWDGIRTQVRALWAEGVSMQEIAPRFGITESAGYKWIKEHPTVERPAHLRPATPRLRRGTGKRALAAAARRAEAAGEAAPTAPAPDGNGTAAAKPRATRGGGGAPRQLALFDEAS